MSDYISEDNLALILRLLPVKTLLQFKCVCKGWKEIIDSSLFIQEHLSLQKPRFLCQNEGDSEYLVFDPNDIFYRAKRLNHPFQDNDLTEDNRLNDHFQHDASVDENRLNDLCRDDDCFDEDDLCLDDDFLDELDYPIDNDFSFGWSQNSGDERNDRIDNDYLFLGTHNGVVCLIDSTNSNLLVWNPSIRKSLTVSIPKFDDGRWGYIDDYSCLGFWINPFTKEFKIILLTCIYNVDAEGDVDDEDGEPTGALYSSIQKEWRVIPITEVKDWVRSPAVMIQNVAHWIGNKTQDGAHIIISFDFVLETFDIIEMPSLKSLNYRFSFTEPMLCHWQGNLTVGAKDGRYTHRYNIYMRQGGMWVNMFGFHLSAGALADKVFWVLGEEEAARVLTEGPHHLVLYDTREGREGIIHSPDEDFDGDYYMDGRAVVYEDAYVAYDFLETLIFP